MRGVERGVFGVVVLLFVFFSGIATADPNEANPNQPSGGEGTLSSSVSIESVALGIEPSLYNFLVYDPYNSTSSNIREALEVLGITNYTVRSQANPVTAADLSSHDILIVGWNNGGSLYRLDPSILGQGITGRVVLSGHDADYHTVVPMAYTPAAPKFLGQAIQFVLTGPGTGMVALADTVTPPFGWLPSSWGVSANMNGSRLISRFTDEGLSSGIFDGLLPSDMNGWGQSYHNAFVRQPWSSFVSLEEGGSMEVDNVTVARFNSYGLTLDKRVQAEPNTLPCVDLWGEAGFTLTYAYPDDPNHTRVPVSDMILVDHIPAEMEYVSSSPEGNHDILNRTVTWDLGTISPAGGGSVTITLQVNEQSEPGGRVVNTATLETAMGVLAIAKRTVEVCCRGGDVIYVNRDATGYNNGTSWENAYTDLPAAIARAGKGCGNQIWIVRGIYSPGKAVTDTFKIPAGVSVYGGFAGTETSIDQRNIPANPTILSGNTKILENGILRRNEIVVTMGDDTLLDGVTITDGKERGVSGLNSNFSIFNCSIENNQRHGIRVDNSIVNIKNCMVRNNGYNGIYHLLGGTILVDHCQIYGNSQNGVNCETATPTIFNSVIFQNGSSGNSYYGVKILQPSGTPLIRNNTIAYNINEGIRSVGANIANVHNCILYGNKNNINNGQFSGNPSINYSLVYDPNYPNRTTPDPNSNISCNPLFAYSDPNLKNFHLAGNSPCINKGSNTGIASDETDMDKTDRIYNSIVDMGADEVSCTDVYSPCDWNGDGVVNIQEYNIFSRAWQTIKSNDPNINDPNYNPVCDLNSDWNVNTTDLALFIPNWLWAACWRTDIQEIQTAAQQTMALSAMAPTSDLTLQAASLSTESATIGTVAETVTPQKSIHEQILELQSTAQFLEQLWLSDETIRQEISPADWKLFMKEVYKSLNDLKTTKTFTWSEEL